MRRPALTSLLALLLLLAQSATAWHALDHNFHQHQVWCDSFTAADHQTPNIQPPVAAVAVTITVKQPVFTPRRATLAGRYHAYFSRAPPAPIV